MASDRPSSKTDKIPMSLIGDLVTMRNQWKLEQAHGRPGGSKTYTPLHTTIKIGNDSTTDLLRGHVLELDETMTNSEAWEAVWPSVLLGVKPTAGNVNIAVLLGPCAGKGVTTSMQNAQVAGICMVKVNVGATWHRRARPVKDSHVLTSGLFGPVEILNELTATGEQLVLCSVGHANNRGVFVKTTTSISAATLTSGRLTLGSGSAEIHNPYTTVGQYDVNSPAQTLTVYNMAGDAVDSGGFGQVLPTDDWLPLFNIDPCTQPT